MIALKVHLAGDGCWPDLAGRDPGQVIHLVGGGEIAALHGGTAEGRPSVCLRLDLPDGRVVLWEQTLRNFQVAAALLRGAFGEVA